MKFRAFFAAGAALLFAVAAGPNRVAAQVTVDVNQGQIQPLPISIAPFNGDHGADIARVVADDLQRSGYFRMVDPSGVTDKVDVSIIPDFKAWQKASTQALVIGGGGADPSGRLGVDFRLYDVNGEHELTSSHFVSTPDNWRRIAHKIADQVYEKLTGNKGWFDTRIVFVAESGPRNHRRKLLTLADWDGGAAQYLTDGAYQVMTPRFSPSGQEVIYTALGDSFTRFYLFNIDTNRQEALGQFSGLVFAPRFSPDGSRVVFSATKNGNSDIWVMDLRSRAQTRLTADPGIDTSPCFSPDGRQLVFNSDRSGSPQLYIMSADGSGVRRLSQGGGRYNTPVWSPDGQWIAFTRQDGNGFSIGIIHPDGSGEKVLSSSYFEEAPTWAPNSQYLMFTREGRDGVSRLWMADVTGRVVAPAAYKEPASDPSWSPLRD